MADYLSPEQISAGWKLELGVKISLETIYSSSRVARRVVENSISFCEQRETSSGHLATIKTRKDRSTMRSVLMIGQVLSVRNGGLVTGGSR